MDINRFFSVFKISGKGLSVQRRNIEIASENIANANTTRRPDGYGPYRPKSMVTTAGGPEFDRALQDSLIQMHTRGDQHRAAPESGQNLTTMAELGPEGKVVELEKFRYEYDPDHPDANEEGMVKYPDVDLVEEMTRIVSANRLYEANLSAIEAEKEIIKRSFEI